MSATDTRPRRPRAFWSDARFLIGIALIAASIAGVWLVVEAARQTVPMVVAARTIVAGQPISAADMREVDVLLGQAQDGYLTLAAASDPRAEARVATRTIEAGELLPVASIGSAEASRLTTVVVGSSTDVPAGVVPGTVVELWSAPMLERGVFDTPSILIADATVAAVAADESMLGAGSTTLELVIERSDVAKTLAAVAAESRLSVVPSAAGR